MLGVGGELLDAVVLDLQELPGGAIAGASAAVYRFDPFLTALETN